MSALKMILAGGVAAAALMSAAPASAQYSPGYPYGIRRRLRAGNVATAATAVTEAMAPTARRPISQCTAAVTQRLNRDQGGYGAYGGGYGAYGGGYGAYGGGYGAYGGARVLGISRVEPSSGGGLTIRGVAEQRLQRRLWRLRKRPGHSRT